MRRIYARVLVLGIMGILGFGVLNGAEQSEGPILKLDQVHPAVYTPPSGTPAAPVAAPTTDIVVPSVAPKELPLLPVTKPTMLPPIDKPIATSEKIQPAIPAIPDVLPPVSPALMPEIKVPAEPPKVGVVVSPRANSPEPIRNNDSAATSIPFTNLAQPTEPSRPNATQTPGSSRVMPEVSIETIAPEFVSHGHHVAYEIVVRNNGPVPVNNVKVAEEIGHGTKLIGAMPVGEINGDKILWLLGALSAGEEKRIKINVKPCEDLDLNTHPKLTYSVATAMSVQVRRPILAIVTKAPEFAQIGEEVPVHIQVTNTGTDEATKIELRATLSDGFKHPEGSDIHALIQKLMPGQSQSLTLRLHAAAPGMQQCSLRTTADAVGKATALAKIEVRQAKLNLAVSGPTKCMVKSEPEFHLELSNSGNCETDPVQVMAAFPEGFDFVSASHGGAYDAAARTITWNLGKAPPGNRSMLTVKAKSGVAGHLAVRVAAQAGPKLHARAEHVIQAEGVPALSFEVADLEDPIEIGRETTYEIRVANTGSTPCTNIRLTAAFSDGLVLGAVTSNVPHQIVGQTLVFEPFAKLPVKGDFTIRIKAKSAVAGDQRLKVQLSCDQLKQPVVKEENTSFFQQ